MKASNKKITKFVQREVSNILKEFYGSENGGGRETNASYPQGTFDNPIFEPWNERPSDDISVNNPIYVVYYLDYKNGELSHKVIDTNLSKNEAESVVERLGNEFPEKTFYFDLNYNLN